MSLREEIKALLPDYVYDVQIDRQKVYGIDSMRVTVLYRDPAGNPWYLDLNVAEKNKMNAEHMAKVINSYIKYDTAAQDRWDDEGGNGANRTR